jgi:hypothetical protein
MKKLILIALLALSGCVTQPRVDPAFEAISQYGQESATQAEAGNITWESRYIRLFELAAGIQHPMIRNGYRLAYNEMIATARKFDLQQMSKDDFSDARRRTSLRVESVLDSARREQAQAQAQYNADMAQILRDGQAQQNVIYQQQMQQYTKPQTNCTSTLYGNTVQTNCR